MIVVDSSVWIANLRGELHEIVRFLHGLRNPGSIIVGDIVLLEVLRGVPGERSASDVERYLRRFRIEAMLGGGGAVSAARLYRDLRSQGITVSKLADLIIAAFCIRYGHSLLHIDRDFDVIAQAMPLRIVDPESDL